MRRSWPALLPLLAACASAPTAPDAFPPARVAGEPRPPSQRDVAWQRCGEEIAALEARALVVHRFGCARCYRFQSDEIVVLPEGRYAYFDLVNRVEVLRGPVPRAALDTIDALLTSYAWRGLDQGPPADTPMAAWEDLQGGGRRVRRNPRAGDALPPPMIELATLLREALEESREAPPPPPLTSCRR